MIDTIDYQYNVPYTLVKADVEYFGKNNYGNILLELKGAKEINESTFQFLERIRLKIKLKDMYECENSLLFSLQNHRNFGGFVLFYLENYIINQSFQI